MAPCHCFSGHWFLRTCAPWMFTSYDDSMAYLQKFWYGPVPWTLVISTHVSSLKPFILYGLKKYLHSPYHLLVFQAVMSVETGFQIAEILKTQGFFFLPLEEYSAVLRLCSTKEMGWHERSPLYTSGCCTWEKTGPKYAYCRNHQGKVFPVSWIGCRYTHDVNTYTEYSLTFSLTFNLSQCNCAWDLSMQASAQPLPTLKFAFSGILLAKLYETVELAPSFMP